MRGKADQLFGELQNPERRGLADKVAKDVKDYEQAFDETHKAITERNALITGSLDKIGPSVADKTEDLKLGFLKEQDALGPRASAAISAAVTTTIVVSLISVVFGMLAAWLIGTGISNPIQAMTHAMTVLAGGDKTIVIPATDHKDEVGDMAQAVQVFKDNMIRADQLAAEQEQARVAREQRTRKVESLTQEFDKSSGGALDSVSSAATQLQSTASSMTATAEETSRQATAVAAAAEQASSNVQTVASAAEELSSSISEISRQVATAARIAGQAVDEARRTDAMVQGLADAASKIGDVVNLINDIASQTNLLALNATIEAARAGDAGKGFAVVANEVKSLANQTAKATDEIGAQITAVQGATRQAVEAIQNIGRTIGDISEINTTIASAVEEQGAATQEIARNVQQASSGTQEVTSNISGVTQAAGETGHAASDVLNASNELGRQASILRNFVQKFLEDVRTA
ncbi:MAG: HAMP domain-containing protein [Alphaproteobacteria bacterium]|nr:HAMP domain-containing protein [Alphaproteobacteria bacterium]